MFLEKISQIFSDSVNIATEKFINLNDKLFENYSFLLNIK